MADWVTISSLATAGGTLVLAVATFSSVRCSNRSARVAERSLYAGMRPVLIPSREDDPIERVRFGDEQLVVVPGHGGALDVGKKAIYLAGRLAQRGRRCGRAARLAGVAAAPGRAMGCWTRRRCESWQCRRASRARGVPPSGARHLRHRGSPGVLDRGAPGREPACIRGDSPGRRRRGSGSGRSPIRDHEGGQRTIVRFVLSPWPEDGTDDKPAGRRAYVIRYWNVDREDPR